MKNGSTDRPFQFTLLGVFVMLTIAGVIFANPETALSLGCSLALMFLGIACVRGACIGRAEGWMSGLIFGLMLTVAGIIASVVTMVLWFA